MKKLILCAVSACAILSTAAVFASTDNLYQTVPLGGVFVNVASSQGPNIRSIDISGLNKDSNNMYVWNVQCDYQATGSHSKINIWGAAEAVKGYIGSTLVNGKPYNYPLNGPGDLVLSSGTISYNSVAPYPGGHDAGIVVKNFDTNNAIKLYNCKATEKAPL